MDSLAAGRFDPSGVFDHEEERTMEPRKAWRLAPATDKRDFYSAGYDGNWFTTEAEAIAAIPDLRACGPEFDHDWVAVEVQTESGEVRR